MQMIEDVEFNEEISKLSVLIKYMYDNTPSTNVFLNRIIYYTLFNCIMKTIELKEGFILLFNVGILSPAFSLNRAIFELWAAACFVEETISDFHVSRNEEKLAKIATGMR